MLLLHADILRKNACYVIHMLPISPRHLSVDVTVSHLRELLILGEKVDGISGCHNLTQLYRSCKTGCSIANYLKSQTQHIFSPCSPCKELNDPQNYCPLSAGKKHQLFAPSPANGATSTQKKRIIHNTQLFYSIPSDSLLHKWLKASGALHVILNFFCMQIKRCPVAHIAQKWCEQIVTSARSGFLIYKAKKTSLQHWQMSFNTRKAQTLLPSFCCSPFSGRCGKVSGVRVFAGSPCQMAVVKMQGVIWLERLQVN